MELFNVGIIIEMIGFALFIISAKGLPTSNMGYDMGTEEEKKKKRLIKFWKNTHLTLPGHWGQIARIFSLVLIIIGLAFQFS